MVALRVRRLRAARRRKRRIASVDHDLDIDQWTALQIAWGECAYCGAVDQRLQRDCVLPISRGGRYTLENVVPACAACNRSKGNDEVTSWLRRKRLDEQDFLLRHVQIRRALLGARADHPVPRPTGRADDAARNTEFAHRADVDHRRKAADGSSGHNL